MTVWEFIGWLIAVPLGLVTALFVYALLFSVVRTVVRGARRRADPIATVKLRVVPKD
jgi:hypothetical protein